MSYSSGEAAEQVVRMTLNGVEVAAKISGKAAERLAVLLYAVLKDQKKDARKTRLNSMLRSGKGTQGLCHWRQRPWRSSAVRQRSTASCIAF